MELKKWQQIKRYLHISNPDTDGDSAESAWTDKIEPLLGDFLKASQKHLTPGRDVSFDELLELFKGRSKHTLQIDCKAVGKDFKAYVLCSGSYLFDLTWSSKTEGISGLDLTKTEGLPETQAIVVQMLERLPHPWFYVVYLDNFFASVKLAKHLRNEMSIALVGTCKSGSGMPDSMLKLRAVFTKKSH